MKRFIKSAEAIEGRFDLEAVHDDVIENIIDYIESGEAMSYDDVVSEVYDQIYYTNPELSDSEEDIVYEAVMTTLEDYHYIDKTGLLLYEAEE